jgi:hypothetical protein
MSSLSITEKSKLEKLLDMSSGYVSSFSDTRFGNFMADVVGLDIHDKKYQGSGTSKAKKLREFWRIESDYMVGAATLALIQYVEENLPESSGGYAEKQRLYEPCRAIARRLLSGAVSLDELKQTAVVFDAAHLADQIRRIEQSVDSDPALAIGTAKELVETCCKTILAERGKLTSGTPDMSVLTKETLKQLQLVPEGVSEEARGGDVVRRILQNLGARGNGLAELRGLYGTGHGREGRATGLKARHAKLAVGAASTLVNFLFDTHKDTVP